MIEVTDEKEAWLSSFERLERKSVRGAGDWLAPLRRRSINRFAETGFPTTREEDWRKTSVAPIARVPFVLPDPAVPDRSTLEAVEALLPAAGEGARLVFIDGRFTRSLFRPGLVLEGLSAGSLAEAIENDPASIEPHLGRLAGSDGHAFVSLNTAFMTDGAFVHVPRGADLSAPVHIVFVSTGRSEPTVVHPRNLIVCQEESRATVVETWIGPRPGVYLTNAVTEIVAAPGARIEHCRVQRESLDAFHVSTTKATLARDSSLTTNSVSLGGALVRNDIGVRLEAEGAECALGGLFIATGRQHVDNHTAIDHGAPHGTSRELYKGILGGAARGVFDGKIVVRPGATKTDALQANPNLLLSDDALIDTKPQLEIYNNDVKCKHAATIGRLDERSLFYLRTRGVGLGEARALLIHAFASEIIARISVETVRADLIGAISPLLLGGARFEVTA